MNYSFVPLSRLSGTFQQPCTIQRIKALVEITKFVPYVSIFVERKEALFYFVWAFLLNNVFFLLFLKWFQNDDWNIDSIFPLNNDFLNDLGDINMDANWADTYDYMSSPTSTSTGTGTESENDHDMLGMRPLANQMLSPPQNLISSSSSDSGLSSDHIDLYV